MSIRNIVITGTGKYIPTENITHEYFENHKFYTREKEPIKTSGLEAANKLEAITGIQERKYLKPNLLTSDMAYEAALEAVLSSKVNIEEIDQIIVAHNFGDIANDSIQTDMIPSLAARVKNKLNIQNPNCVAYDIIFGCPGWLQGVIQAYTFIKAGVAKKCLVIGAESISRVVDPHDRDSMIYADGAGATIIEEVEEDSPRGIINFKAQTYANDEVGYLYNGPTFSAELNDNRKYIKMYGRKIYEFALSRVPKAMQACFDESGFEISDLKKIFIHQANEKMDEAIVKRFYRSYKTEIPEGIMPMSINHLGNSSVATIPTLFDMVQRKELGEHSIDRGDVVLFASVGAGMNINAVTYVI